MAVTTMIGAKIHRREDPKLVTGHGSYVDDLRQVGMVYMSVVRSAQAHARVKSIDLTEASKAPGVVAIYTARDFKTVLSGGLPVTESLIADKKYQFVYIFTPAPIKGATGSNGCPIAVT